jgi:hypothetical protein
MKKKDFLIIFLSCAGFINLMAGDPKYPVSDIPEPLRANVNAVFREDQMIFTILSKSKASYYVHQVITIFNEKGKKYASEVVGYDKLSKIKDLNGTVYDANGKQIKRLRNSEIYDQSAFDGFSLYSDNRFKAVNLTQGTYPYTVEFEYEIEFKYLFFIPSFILVPEERVAVQNSSYCLRFPENLAPRYKVNNTEVKPREEKTNEGLKSLTWVFSNILPIKFEPHGPSRDELVVSINAAPTNFEYENYIGTMTSWELFGQWITSLNKGRDQLPEASRQAVLRLTENMKTPEEKVKALYEFLQNKTRYVSIQLGIGGFQPFEASVVDQTGYGDCKALSNYMVSMLNTINIPAHYVLIRAGEDASSIKTDFPSSQFNHAIVAVPNGADTLWLECTSQSNPFGYQGSFTGDRKALLITDKGGKIVNTIRYTAEQNLQSTSGDVYVDMNGDATAKVKTTYSGLKYENGNLHFNLGNQYDDQKKWIQQNTRIPSFDLNSFSITDHKSKIPSAFVNLDLTLKRFATISGKRIFLTPNLMNRSTYIPEKVEGRKTNVVRTTAYTDHDTIRYHLPEGIYPEYVPEPVKVTSRFGEYEASYQLDQGSLVYVRKVKMKKGVFPPESYQELIDFYRGIMKADQTKIVFMSKT